MKQVMISTDHMSHVYQDEMGREVHALQDVSVHIHEGEFVSIIGTNGSGKSTLAKHFNVLLQPTSGTVTVLGMDTKEEHLIWNIRQNVAWYSKIQITKSWQPLWKKTWRLGQRI